MANQQTEQTFSEAPPLLFLLRWWWHSNPFPRLPELGIAEKWSPFCLKLQLYASFVPWVFGSNLAVAQD
jgi:hypothetical protein